MNAPFLNEEILEKKRRAAKVRAGFVRWHRRIGLAAALLVMLLSVTGVLLSHAARLNLYDTTISSGLAGVFYANKPATAPVGEQTASGWLVWLDQSLYLGTSPLKQNISGLRGVVEAGEILVIASDKEVLLYTTDGLFIERLNGAALPGVPDRIALYDGDKVLMESQGLYYIAGADFLSWDHVQIEDATAIGWSTPTHAMPQQVEDAVMGLHGVSEITAHRFIADLHSGRAFGAWGPFVMDIAAIFIVVLALSGFYLWWRQRSVRANHLAQNKFSDNS